MDSVVNWNAEAVLSILRAYSYGWWSTIILALRKGHRELFESDEWLLLAERFGFKEGQALAKSLPKVASLDKLVEALRRSHWSLMERAEVVRLGDEVRMKINDCSALRAMAANGINDFPCHLFTIHALKGLAKALGSEVEVSCILEPSTLRRGPSCEWSLKLKEAR